MSALISGFCSMKRLAVFLLPLDGILVHRRLPPSILSGCPQSNLLVPIYTPGWRETTWVHQSGLELSTFRSQVRRSNHCATTSPSTNFINFELGTVRGESDREIHRRFNCCEATCTYILQPSPSRCCCICQPLRPIIQVFLA